MLIICTLWSQSVIFGLTSCVWTAYVNNRVLKLREQFINQVLKIQILFHHQISGIKCEMFCGMSLFLSITRLHTVVISYNRFRISKSDAFMTRSVVSRNII